MLIIVTFCLNLEINKTTHMITVKMVTSLDTLLSLELVLGWLRENSTSTINKNKASNKQNNHNMYNISYEHKGVWYSCGRFTCIKCVCHSKDFLQTKKSECIVFFARVFQRAYVDLSDCQIFLSLFSLQWDLIRGTQRNPPSTLRWADSEFR